MAKLHESSAVSCPLNTNKSTMGLVMKDALMGKEFPDTVYEDKDDELLTLIDQEFLGTGKFQEPSLAR